ncbi:MAG: hypothetical protein JXQ30_08705 [Spirochaetes bacterium]|nr:hypothetical protein [Spirochaetota bacterium]
MPGPPGLLKTSPLLQPEIEEVAKPITEVTTGGPPGLRATSPLLGEEVPEDAVKQAYQIADTMADPEEQRAKINNSLLLAQELKMRPSQAYNSHDAIIKVWTGKSNVSAKTFGEYLKDKFTIGRIQDDIGILSFAQMAGDDSEETQAKIEKLQSKMPSPEMVKRALPARIVGEVMEQAPLWIAGAKEGVYRAAPTAFAFGMTAFMLGQIPPATAALEEAITVPAATAMGFKLGFGSAAIEHIGKVEGGLAYREMIERGIDPQIAKWAGASVGIINMLLEMSEAQVVVGSLSNPAKRLLKKSIRKVVRDASTSPRVLQALGKGLGRYTGDVGINVGQEIAQETTNILFSELAVEINNRAKGNPELRHEWEQALPRLKEITVKSTEGMVGMLFPGSALNTAVMAKAAFAEAQKSESLKASEEAATEQAIQIGKMGKQEMPPTRKITPRVTAQGAVKQTPVPSEEVSVEEIGRYFEERSELADKIEDVKLRNEVQLGKAKIKDLITMEDIKKEARALREEARAQYVIEKSEGIVAQIEDMGGINVRFFKGSEEVKSIPKQIRRRVFTTDEFAMDLDEAANMLGMTDNELIEQLKSAEVPKRPSSKVSDYIAQAEVELLNDLNAGNITESEYVELKKAIEVSGKKIEEAGRKGLTIGKRMGSIKQKEHYREIQQRVKEKKVVREYIKKLARRISKPPSANTDLYYAQAIEYVQDGIDPSFRMERTLEKREKTREYLERHPEARDYMPKEVLDMLDKKPLNELSIEELEEIDAEIARLKQLGHMKYEYKKALRDNEWTARRNGLLSSIMGGKPFKPSKEEYIGKPKREPIRTGYYLALIPQSLFDLIDGGKGTYSGPFYNTYYNEVNNLENRKWRHIDKRMKTVKIKLEKLEVDFNTLMKKRIVGDKKYTVADMMGIYGLSLNKLSLAAIIYGNMGNMDPFVARDQVIAIRKALTDQEKKAVEVIMEDFEESYSRIREAFIEYKNQDLGKQQNYLPMYRQEVAKEMLDEMMAEELLNRMNLKKGYPPRGFTYERLEKIPSEFQKPIKTNILEIWADGVQRQEHFVSFAEKIRDLHKFNQDPTIRSAIEQKFGRSMLERVKNYTNAIGNPNIYKQYTDIEKFSAVARRHAALAYLSFNLVTMAKQVPSFFYYMCKAGPAHLMGSLIWCATHPKQAIEFVNQDPQMEHRSLERELEELQRIDKAAYERIINKIGKVGFFGIRAFDKAVTTVGYIATYTKHTDMGYSDRRAREVALNETLRTQPAAQAKDIAEIYRSNEVLNWFLQFSNQLNKIWNMTAYDIPAQFKGHKYHVALLEAVSIGLGAIFIWSLTHRRWPDKKEDIADALSENGLNMVPGVGRMINASRSGWKSSAPAVLKSVESIGTAISKGVSAKRRINAIIEGGAVAMGLPYISVKRGVKMIENRDLRELIGGPPKE